MAIARIEHVKPGSWVFTSDQRRIGCVKDVRGGYFKVDAPMQRDFWLSGSLIEHCADNSVMLAISGERISDHQLGEPGSERPEDPMASIAGAPVISPEEQLEQRARMERELAEQSRSLTPDHPSVTQERGPRAWEKIPADHAGFGELAGQYVPNAPVQDQMEHDLDTGARDGMKKRGTLAATVAVAAAAVAVSLLVLRRRRQNAKSRARTLIDDVRSHIDDLTDNARDLVGRAA